MNKSNVGIVNERIINRVKECLFKLVEKLGKSDITMDYKKFNIGFSIKE